MLRALAIATWLAAGLCVGVVARAQEGAETPDPSRLAEARALFERGLAAADAERWAEAVELFRRARDLVERPSIVFNLGQALVRLGRAAEAHAALDRFIAMADPRVDAADVARAQRLLAELTASRGTLVLAVDPEDALVEVDGGLVEGDGAERTLALDPGRHRVVVSAPGHRADRFEISVLSGASERRSALLERLPSRPATLLVHANEGAEVRVDGLLAGRGDIERELEPGAHRVQVVEGTSTTLERELLVTDGERVVLDAAVGRGSIADEPWLWVIIGLAVGGAGIGIGVGVALATAPTDPAAGYAGTTGVRISAIRF